MDDLVLVLATEIVSAHIANNPVSLAQLPTVIREVHHALATAGAAPVEPAKPKPAVTARNSVFASHILCLDCGGKFTALKRHIQADHGMSPDEYRTKWDLPASYPMVAPDYAAARSKIAKQSGLGEKIRANQRKQRGLPKKR